MKSAWKRIGANLFDASDRIADVAERRRMRLLSMMMLVQTVLFFVCAVSMASVDESGLQRTVSWVLGGAGLVCGAIYVLSRSRHVLAAVWSSEALYVAIPLVILATTAGSPDVRPFESITYLLMAILVGSIMLSTRGTLLLGGITLGSTAVVAWVGPAAWHTDLVHGGQFLFCNIALVTVFKIHRDRIELDRAAELRARNEELEALRRNQEHLIAERTAELTARTDAMRQLLDNVDQGLFTIDRSGTLDPEVSATLVRWFGEPRPGDELHTYLGRVSPALGSALETGWQQVVEDVLPREVSIGQLPDRFEVGQQVFHIAYSAIGGGQVERDLVVVTDVTAERDREKLNHEKRETLALFEQFISDRAAVCSFIDEGDAQLRTIEASGSVEGAELRRVIHTLKGNSALFGISSVSSLCHAMESEIAREGAPTFESITRLADTWRRVRTDVQRFNRGHTATVELSAEEYGGFLAALAGKASRAELVARFASLALEPVERRLRHFAAQAGGIAARAGKDVHVAVDHDDLRLNPRRWAGIWSQLVHAIRNALDHGIETPEERLAAGKTSAGNLRLVARRRGDAVVLAVEDDGRGIDWESVRRAAVARGLSATSHGDLVAALLSDGLTTSVEVTEMSGRGVGMGALARSVAEIGGNLSITSEAGVGTRLELVVPHANAFTVPPPAAAIQRVPRPATAN